MLCLASHVQPQRMMEYIVLASRASDVRYVPQCMMGYIDCTGVQPSSLNVRTPLQDGIHTIKCPYHVKVIWG